MNPDNFNMSEQELNAQRRRRAENFKLNIDESEYEDDNLVKSEDEPSNLNSYSGQDVKKQMARESKQVLKQKKKEEKKALKAKNKYNRRTFRFIWIISVLIVGAMAAVYMITGMNDLLAVNRTDSSTVKIEIPENPTVDDVTKVLVDNKVIGEPSYFKLFVNVTKSADDFTQGTYEIRRNMDYEAIINFFRVTTTEPTRFPLQLPRVKAFLKLPTLLKRTVLWATGTSFFRFAIPKSLTATLTLSRLKQMRTSVTTSLRAISIPIPTNSTEMKMQNP